MPSQRGSARRAGAVRAQTPRLERARQGQVASPQVDHVPQRGLEEKIDVRIWRREAQLAPAGLVQEPSEAFLLDLVGEL